MTCSFAICEVVVVYTLHFFVRVADDVMLICQAVCIVVFILGAFFIVPSTPNRGFHICGRK